MGYMIAQCLANTMGKRNLTSDATCIVTTVLVDAEDPAFNEPSKAIGPLLSAADAELHRTRDGWVIREEGAGKFRRVVASPVPRKIIEMPAIARLVEAGQIVVCCGGGGIPVAVDQWGVVRGIAAVIDKDRTTGILARELDTTTLVILTAVEYACIHFGKPNQERLEQITADQAEEFLQAGHFAAGSMRPKIETAIDFVRHSPHADAAAIIAHVNHFADALDGISGTRIVR
jgi:carbamate kinase